MLRTGIEEMLAYFEKGRNVILIAPTSYGKTYASPELLKIARSSGRAWSLIHVVPIRTLVNRIIREKFSMIDKDMLGYQSMDVIEGYVKSPFFLRDLVVTTLDSFMLNLYRVPVAEVVKIAEGVSQGHFYVSLASILSSVIVFDEAHVYTGSAKEDNSVVFVRAAVKYLADIKIPMVVETATMNSKLALELYELMKKPVLIYVGSSDAQLGNLKHLGSDLIIVKDDNFENTYYEVKWETRLIEEAMVKKLARDLCRDRVVLIIRNTIRKAINTYESLKDDIDCESALIHGLLSNGDRASVEERIWEIQRKGRGLVVATQVMEAGVEGEASVLITDAAPIENLAQRAGRLCRYRGSDTEVFRQCVDDAGKVYIVELDPDATRKDVIDVYDKQRVITTIESIRGIISKGMMIDWRLLRDGSGKVSFVTIIENVRYPGYQYVDQVKQALFSNYLWIDDTPDLFFEMLERLDIKGFLKDDVLVRLSFGDSSDHDDLERNSVTIELSRLLNYEKKRIYNNEEPCLEYDRDGKVMVYVLVRKKKSKKNETAGIMKMPSAILSIDWIRRRQGKIDFKLSFKIYEPAEKPPEDLVFEGLSLSLNRKCYENGKGLIIWEEGKIL